MRTGTHLSGDGHPRTQSDERNRLLKGLDPDVCARLVDEGESLELSAKQVLWPPLAPPRSVYSPRSCVTSLIVPLEDERPIEAGTVGREGFEGAPVALGVQATTIVVTAQRRELRSRDSVQRRRGWPVTR